MSLLDRGRETVVVFPEEVYTDPDGNVLRRPRTTGTTVTNVVVQLLSQSGTSQRRAEQDNEGQETEEMYRLRLPRSYTGPVLGAHGRVQWRGLSWAVIGKERRYNGSYRTAHIDYVIRRT